MSSRSADKIKIASFDDLFGEQIEVGVEQIINVKLSEFPNATVIDSAQKKTQEYKPLVKVEEFAGMQL